MKTTKEQRQHLSEMMAFAETSMHPDTLVADLIHDVEEALAENSHLASALNKAVDLLCDIPLHEEDDALILRREEVLNALKTSTPSSATDGGTGSGE